MPLPPDLCRLQSPSYWIVSSRTSALACLHSGRPSGPTTVPLDKLAPGAALRHPGPLSQHRCPLRRPLHLLPPPRLSRPLFLPRCRRLLRHRASPPRWHPSCLTAHFGRRLHTPSPTATLCPGLRQRLHPTYRPLTGPLVQWGTLAKGVLLRLSAANCALCPVSCCGFVHAFSFFRQQIGQFNLQLQS